MTVMLRRLLVHWRSLIVVLVPLILLPLVISPSTELRCAFVVILMSTFWMTEAIPLPITSLLPVVLFPLLGVLETEQVCISYLKETNMMFIGGLIVAIAVEHCNLHKRIALRTTLLVGTSPMRIMLGFMVTTMILSMWISNTATTAMMTPIVQAVLEELKAHREVENGVPKGTAMVAMPPSDTTEQSSGAFDQDKRRKSVIKGELEIIPRPDNETVAYMLGIAYASNLGGAGTLTGTGTNLIFKGIYDGVFKNTEGINFANWMIFNVPLMLINVFATWLWLQFFFLGLFRKKTREQIERRENDDKVKELIRRKYNELGPMSFHEGVTLCLFITVALLWFFREPEFIPGWASYVSSTKIKDATPVMLIVILFFVLPANLDFLKFNSDRKPMKAAPALLNWKVIHDKVPWGLVLLLGGGFAMAAASKSSGLSRLMGEKLVALQVLPPVVIMMLISTATTFITEVSSNTAVANIVLPVLAEMAIVMKIHPLYFMIPAVLCCSYAFMLPVSTPPNAIVMSASNMRTTDMMKAGLGMNIICLVILFIFFPTLGTYIYSLDEFPAYLNATTNSSGVPSY